MPANYSLQRVRSDYSLKCIATRLHGVSSLLCLDGMKPALGCIHIRLGGLCRGVCMLTPFALENITTVKKK